MNSAATNYCKALAVDERHNGDLRGRFDTLKHGAKDQTKSLCEANLGYLNTAHRKAQGGPQIRAYFADEYGDYDQVLRTCSHTITAND